MPVDLLGGQVDRITELLGRRVFAARERERSLNDR